MLVKDRLPKILKSLEAIVGADNLRTDDTELALYSYDAGLGRARPEAVVTITDTAMLEPLLQLLDEAGVPHVARGAGTNFSGGCIPLKGGVILNLAPLNKILEIDTAAGYALVEPGVTVDALKRELRPLGFFYAPDPSSSSVCTIGGTVAENAAGPSALKYGSTIDNVLELDWLMPDGTPCRSTAGAPGPDLCGFLCGTEGTIGIITRIKLKIRPVPPAASSALAAFRSINSAMDAVAEILRCGITPRAAEAMDRMTTSAVEAYAHTGFATDSEAALLLEFEGEKSVVEEELKTAQAVCMAYGALKWSVIEDRDAQVVLWEGRRGAYAALSRLAPSILIEDTIVPRAKLPATLKNIQDISAKYDLRVGLTFHAGEGNMHPHIVFDDRNRFETAKIKKAASEMIKVCAANGGSIAAEHGVGVDKRAAMNLIYDRATIEFMKGLKNAFDPYGLANPDKILPVSYKDDEGCNYFDGLTDAARDLALETRRRASAGEKSVITGSGSSGIIPRSAKENRLETAELASVPEFDLANMTVCAEAGLPVRELKKTVESSNLFLNMPDYRGTVGGLLATNPWPELRRLVLGMQVLLPSGEVLTFGGRTLKQTAGYNLWRLFCGSYGWYGIILSATFRLSAKQLVFDEKLRAERPFEPDETHMRLKRFIDPSGLFNDTVVKQK